MEAKKTMKIIFILAVVAILFFLGVLLLNSHIENKAENTDSNASENYVAQNTIDISSSDLQEGDSGVSIVVYEDYSDVFSADFAKTLEQAKADFPGKLKIAYRFYNASNSNMSDQLALALLCANEQKQGLGMRQELFKQVGEINASGDVVQNAIANIDINQDTFNTCLTNADKREQIKDMNAVAEQLSVYGAPTAFIGEEIIVGAKPYENFTDSNGDEIEGLKQIIERQLN